MMNDLFRIDADVKSHTEKNVMFKEQPPMSFNHNILQEVQNALLYCVVILW